MLCKGEDLSQRTDNIDLAVATLVAGADFNPINERTDEFNSLRACRLISQNLLQFGDLPAVEVGWIAISVSLGWAFKSAAISRFRVSSCRN